MNWLGKILQKTSQSKPILYDRWYELENCLKRARLSGGDAHVGNIGHDRRGKLVLYDIADNTKHPDES